MAVSITHETLFRQAYIFIRRGTTFTYFPYTPDGESRFQFFKQVVAFHPIRNTLAAQDWNITAAGSHFALALFTFLYVDIIDCTATLYSMARFSGAVDPKTGDFPRSTIAYCTDAMTISIGSLFGCSPVTAFIESGAGITEGGRTGLTAITTGICFLISIFFAPIFASIPPWATGCSLILVGCMMMRQVVSVNWSYIGDALPAFVTIVSIPYTYSVAYGLIAGLMTYTALNGSVYLTQKISMDRLAPPDADNAEYWTYKPSGGTAPWFIRVAHRKFWQRGDMESIDGNSATMEHELAEKRHSEVRSSDLWGCDLFDTCIPYFPLMVNFWYVFTHQMLLRESKASFILHVPLNAIFAGCKIWMTDEQVLACSISISFWEYRWNVWMNNGWDGWTIEIM